MYDVSVVIPNYNGIKYLEHCLEALEKQRAVSYTHLDVYKRQFWRTIQRRIQELSIVY